MLETAMEIGICLPYLEPGLTREDYLGWFRRIDAGPFSTLACGERVHGPASDMRTLLAAAAIATERVAIAPTLYVLPMHPPVQVAKEVATLDLLSGGRLKHLGLGYGGREQDYEALGVPYRGRYGRMDDYVKVLRRTWAGEEIVAGAGAIGPALARASGPPLIAGAIGPRSIARCAQWADGLYAWSANAERQELENAFAAADAAWEAAGRAAPPRRISGFWYSLADDAQARLYRYAYDYLAIAGPEIATWMAESVHRSHPDAILAALDNAEAAGCEEVFMVPATADIEELERLLPLLARR